MKELVKNMLGPSFFNIYIYQVIHIRDDVYIKISKKGITLQNFYARVNFLNSMLEVFTQIIKQLTSPIIKIERGTTLRENLEVKMISTHNFS